MKKIYKKHQLKILSIQSFVTNLGAADIRAGADNIAAPIVAPASVDTCTQSSSPC